MVLVAGSVGDPSGEETQTGVSVEEEEELAVVDKLSKVSLTDNLNVESYSQLSDGTLLCNLCNKKYKLIGPMKKHLEKNHEILDAVIFKCKKCNYVFPTQKQLTRHEKSKSDCSFWV